MKFFMDTEFIEYPCTIDLASIGIVSENNDKLYLESSECDWSKANKWVLENVKPKMQNIGIPRIEIKRKIYKFIKDRCKIPEFWGYYSDYDWVVFCWIFGDMSKLPSKWPRHCLDMRQLMTERGIRRNQLPICSFKHNALEDAIWNKLAFERIESLSPVKPRRSRRSRRK